MSYVCFWTGCMMDHFQNFSESYFEGWSNMKWLSFILVKFWFIDDIIIWFPGERGGAGLANNQMIIHLKDHMIPVHSVFGDVVTGSSESSAIISSCDQMTMVPEPKPQSWRWLAARFQLGPQVNIICCEPQKTKNHHDVFLKVVGHKKLKSWRLFPLNR